MRLCHPPPRNHRRPGAAGPAAALLMATAVLAAAALWPPDARAELRLCARSATQAGQAQDDGETVALDLPGGHMNTLVLRGDPEARFVLRWDSPCDDGHAFRQVGDRVTRLPQPHCFQQGRLTVSMRMGCMWLGLESKKGGGTR